MRTYLAGLLAVSCMCAPVAAYAAAQFPDSKKLRPIPATVHPNISGNVNYVSSTSAEEIVVPGDQTATSQGASSTTVPGRTYSLALIVSLAIALAIACLVFVWRILRE